MPLGIVVGSLAIRPLAQTDNMPAVLPDSFTIKARDDCLNLLVAFAESEAVLSYAESKGGTTKQKQQIMEQLVSAARGLSGRACGTLLPPIIEGYPSLRATFLDASYLYQHGTLPPKTHTPSINSVG